MCRGKPPLPPPSDDLHTSKDDAHAALSRYQEFVCRVAIRDSEKKCQSVSQSVSQSQITVNIMLMSAVRATVFTLRASVSTLQALWACV